MTQNFKTLPRIIFKLRDHNVCFRDDETKYTTFRDPRPQAPVPVQYYFITRDIHRCPREMETYEFKHYNQNFKGAFWLKKHCRPIFSDLLVVWTRTTAWLPHHLTPLPQLLNDGHKMSEMFSIPD